MERPNIFETLAEPRVIAALFGLWLALCFFSFWVLRRRWHLAVLVIAVSYLVLGTLVAPGFGCGEWPASLSDPSRLWENLTKHGCWELIAGWPLLIIFRG